MADVDTDAIRTTIESYLARFSADDREGWLDLFAVGATLEDPVGSPIRTGREEIGEFYDIGHSLADAIELRPLGILNVCGDEAAFAFEVRPTVAGTVYRATAIDAMRFDADARITSMRAYWEPGAIVPAPADA